MSVDTEPMLTTAGSLEGRRVLVSGGAAGLGAAVCRAVHDAGGTPLVIDVRPGPPDMTSETADLADTAAAEAAVGALARAAGGLDAVVTCAGVDTPAPFGSLPSVDWERIVRVNLFGT